MNFTKPDNTDSVYICKCINISEYDIDSILTKIPVIHHVRVPELGRLH